MIVVLIYRCLVSILSLLMCRCVWVNGKNSLYSISIRHTTMWSHGETGRTNKCFQLDMWETPFFIPFPVVYRIFQAYNTDTGFPSTSYDISNTLLPCNMVYLVLKLYISFSIILYPPLYILALYLPMWPPWNRWNISYQRFRVLSAFGHQVLAKSKKQGLD